MACGLIGVFGVELYIGGNGEQRNSMNYDNNNRKKLQWPMEL